MIPIAILGCGKIARDQHVPTIARSAAFEFVGVVGERADDLGVPAFPTLRALVEALPAVRALSVCTPPIGRLASLREALDLGLDVMMEKPPAATLSEAESLVPLAAAAGRALHLSWHSREAAAVAAAERWLRGREIRAVEIRWLEDVRVWHPGQEWIWRPGIGVFDPAINALSILTRLIPGVMVRSATLEIPADRAAPIAASVAMETGGGAPIDARFSFDERGPQTWTIRIHTDGGSALLEDGGARLSIDGTRRPVAHESEYANLYARFAELIVSRSVDADLSPFRLVADAFLLGERRTVAPFHWAG